ncbi:hypothetical protein [Noviherbaspirillum soli]|uniref:hypothetical protein n=1 Tax=Noviherbaspirillum soli TaxID=1064518 RepID=UPI00188C09DA|nr:hypothetical protein [Noviherbaspirillum soli]
MALINFYKLTPSHTQVASDLNNDELAVFNHGTSGARELAEKVAKDLDFDINVHHENTILKWHGADYFVMVRSSFDYPAIQEELRAAAAEWVGAGCPDQVKRIKLI